MSSEMQIEYAGIVMYVGAGAKDIWFHAPGYYWGDPLTWMNGPFDTMVGAYEAFERHVIEMAGEYDERKG